MILAVDIGNSRAHFGVFEDDRLVRSFSQATSDLSNAASAPVSELLELRNIEQIAIASVVPPAVPGAREHLHRLMPTAQLTVLANAEIPIINRYRHSEQVGIDRLLGSLAAYRLYSVAAKRPVIVIDLGTATTFDCVNAEGEYLGGIIALGIEASASHLSSIAAQLPKVDLQFPPRVLGRSTVESMQSGIMFGAVDAIEGLVRRLREEVFPTQPPIIVATGGLSSLLKSHTTIVDHYEPALVLRGIVLTSYSL